MLPKSGVWDHKKFNSKNFSTVAIFSSHQGQCKVAETLYTVCNETIFQMWPIKQRCESIGKTC